MMKNVWVGGIVCIFLSSVFALCSAEAARLTDMTGREIEVPDKIDAIFGTSPIATYLVYVMDPDLLVGRNSGVTEEAQKYLTSDFAELPILGGWFGQGKVSNLEKLLQAKPDIILSWRWGGTSMDKKIAADMARFQIPVVNVNGESLDRYPDVFRFMGRLLHREKRGNELADYAQQLLDRTAKVRAGLGGDEQPRVYYAEGPRGLKTECDSSWHAQLIPQSGGVNVHHCTQEHNVGMTQISMEQVLSYNPQVILVHDREFLSMVKTDPRWQNIEAVKEGRIYRIPTVPFNWFDRPPSCMRLLGLEWLMSQLFPQKVTWDLKQEVHDFYRLFLKVELSDEQVAEILGER